MSGRFGNRWRYRSRVRYARGRYSGRRVGAARRARGNQRAANQQNDISNVTINLMKKIKTGVIGYGVLDTTDAEHPVVKNVYEIGTCALNIFELLRQSEFYQSYSNMYDQFRINRIQVKVTPVTWQTYNQFNIPNAVVNNDQNQPVPGVPGGQAAYPSNYSHPDNAGENTSGTKFIVPQALTIVTAWDRTGLDDTQLSTGLATAELPKIGDATQQYLAENYRFTTIGDKITTYSSAKSTQLVAGANFNCVRYLYPSSQQEKSLYFSTSELVQQIGKTDASDKWYTMPVSGTWDSKNITNLHSDPNCPFKPTFLIGVLKVDDIIPNTANANAALVPEDSKGQIYPVTFNLEFDIGVTFRGLRKTQVV